MLLAGGGIQGGQVIGRSDDMVVVRGINVFPTMVAEVINRIDALSGEYRIVLSHPPPYDALPIEVELDADRSDASAIAGVVEGQIKNSIGVSAQAHILAPESLPRTHKPAITQRSMPSANLARASWVRAINQ